MDTCPSCGSSKLEDGACLQCGARPDPEAQIAEWLGEATGTSDSGPVEPGAVCTACGYSGEMIGDAGATRCPVCQVVIPARRTDDTIKVIRVVECSECGQSIGLGEEDEGKTVICPRCSCFLGTFAVRAARDARR